MQDPRENFFDRKSGVNMKSSMVPISCNTFIILNLLICKSGVILVALLFLNYKNYQEYPSKLSTAFLFENLLHLSVI